MGLMLCLQVKKEIDLLATHGQNLEEQKTDKKVFAFIWVSSKQKLACKVQAKLTHILLAQYLTKPMKV